MEHGRNYSCVAADHDHRLENSLNIVPIGFGIFISIIGLRLLRKAIAGIMDEADTDLLKKIISHLNEHRHPAWVDLHNMRVIKYGNVLHVDCHLTVPWYYNVREAH